ncbi:hypothetical protein IAU60_003093 [Kwoniella sp. DSM 27419]
MADPYDDDGFFDNLETLNMIAAVEERAIQASQAAPKPKFSQPVRHVLAKPRHSPSAARGRVSPAIREPRPLNTEPRVQKSGFGWEEGGKRSIEGNLERHVEAIKQREAYWSAHAEEEESAPIDVVMDGSGRYELGQEQAVREADEAVVTDNRRAQPFVLGESLGLAGPSTATANLRRKQSEDAVAARRRAIAEAAGVATNGSTITTQQKQPLSRSNSASSLQRELTSQTAVGGFRPTPPGSQQGSNKLHVQAQVQPPNHSQKFSNNRSLSRSVSAGAQIFHRTVPSAAAGPSRLPTIPSQQAVGGHGGIHASSNGSDPGPPPASQGSLARMATIELEIERKKRQELEEELAALRAARAQQDTKRQAETIRPVNAPRTEDDGQEDREKRIKELQNQVWAAKGEAETMRRAQMQEHQRHLAELERLRASLIEKDAEMKEREAQQKRALESMKHQAVFSNHAVLNSAVKNRPPQSQRFPAGSQSQYRAMPTPVRNGSPSRRRSETYEGEATPLIKSIKGKGKAGPGHFGPVFGGLNNAFATSPTVGPRSKRQKTVDISPATSPTKGRGLASSPFRASPVKPQRHRTSSPGTADEADEADEEAAIDWGQEHNDILDPLADGPVQRDEKAELLYHLFNHVIMSSFQSTMGMTTEPTIYRIINYRPPLHVQGHELYMKHCSDLLRACGDAELSAAWLIRQVVRCADGMMSCLLSALAEVALVTLSEIAALCSALSFVSSTTALFPEAAQELAVTSIPATCRSLVNAVYSDPEGLSRYRNAIAPVLESEPGDATAKANEDARSGWYLELADCIVELCETMTFQLETPSWQDDELVNIIMTLTANHQHKFVTRRGLELFYTASSRKVNFRPLITTLVTHKSGSNDQSPLIERLSRLLIVPHPAASLTESLKMSLLIVRGLCMLAISHADAVILMGQKSILVAALILVLQRESTKLYGVHADSSSGEDALALLMPSLSLLHHLVFPSPPYPSTESVSQVQSQSPETDAPVGIDLSDRLHSASATREFNGLQHVFVSALGCMAYGQVDEDVLSEVDQRSIQFLSGDLLENVVEGPEGDAIYELYAPLDEEDGGAGGGGLADTGVKAGMNQGGLREGADGHSLDPMAGQMDVDEDVYRAMPLHEEEEYERGQGVYHDRDQDVIVIDDD